MEKISIKFLDELFLLCLKKREVTEIVVEFLEYSYIPKELPEYKKILKSIKTTYKLNQKTSSVGIISEDYARDSRVQEALTKIQDSKFADKELMLYQLETFIKKNMFIRLNEKLSDLYNKNKHDEAIELQAKESIDIVNFSIKASKAYFSPIYKGFEIRLSNRQIKDRVGEGLKDKVPFGIEPLDAITYGGVDVSDTVLWIMRSGVGKSTVLKWQGISAARRHRNVLHVQLEGSQEECEDKYDQLWTATLYNDIKRGNINDAKYKKLQSIIKKMTADVYVHAYEQFNIASMRDIRDLIIDFEKINGHVDEVIIDYLKYVHPGDGIKYGVDTQSIKMKKENAADKMKNVAKEFGTRIITADQATDVDMSIWNDPTKVLRRNNLVGAKGLVDSFSYFLTGNQTIDERKNKIMRIHCEKLRHYALPDKPLSIATNYKVGRFYNGKRTKSLYYNETKQSFIY